MADKNDFNLNDMLGSLFGFPMPSAGGRGAGDSGQEGDAAGGAASGGSGDGGKGGGTPQVNIDFSGAFNKMAAWSKRALVILAVVLVAVLAFCYWWFHPAINLHSEGVWWWLLLFALVIAVGVWVWALRHHKDTSGKEARKKWVRRALIVPVVVLAVFAIGKIAGFSIIPGNAHRYATVLETQDGNFAQDISEVNYSEVPVIDRASAILLGNRAMGSIPEYVSQFEISDMYSQINYHGKPVRVSPLNYADLFKWLTNRANGIPAYVIVDMTTQNAEVVRLDQPIKYSESEPLARNIDRYVQLRYPTYMFDEKSFEIDEDGTPWWVFPVQKRTIGLFDGTDIQRVVLVNACTGETQDYAIGDCPQWVDRAYPSDLLITQYNWSGLYLNGWLNSWLGQTGVKQTTPGSNGMAGYNYIAKDDDVYLYTGVSSVTADNSIIGFILVNQRTGESRFYSVAGATEDSAMVSAEGQVQNLRYTATFPLLLNISGQPTYFMALKDSAGLVKMYAMVNIEQYQNVAVGNTVAECQANYLTLLAQQGVLSADDVDASIAVAAGGPQVTGTIKTIAQAVIDGNSHFYVTLEPGATQTETDPESGTATTGNAPAGAIYDFALPNMIGIVTYQVGDDVSFTYTVPDGGEGTGADANAGASDALVASGFVGDYASGGTDGMAGAASSARADGSSSAGADGSAAADAA